MRKAMATTDHCAWYFSPPLDQIVMLTISDSAADRITTLRSPAPDKITTLSDSAADKILGDWLLLTDWHSNFVRH